MSESAYLYALTILNRYIDENHLRHTDERKSVLMAVTEMSGRFCIDDIKMRMEETGKGVSRATVANVMKCLVDCGLVLVVGSFHRNVLYQCSPVPSGKSVKGRIPIGVSVQCTECGQSKIVRDKEATAALACRRYKGFSPLSGIVTIYGVCKKCSTLQKSKNRKSK